ncbi:probable thiopurine S-methyltransferase [Dysidea avara]|uniref:probable thiopurine S-methyltransferase n=1 Tax=Dysidea avara TaxID=196820 RepID=UPI00331AAA9F
MTSSEILQQWQDKWTAGEPRWHINHVDTHLQKYIDQLTGGNSGQHILVPLCGRSLDLKWLVDQGHSVVGVEISTGAASGIFSDAGLSPKVTLVNSNLTLYEACEGRLKVFAGDMLCVSSDICGPFDCIWDKNSFGAISPADRERYVDICHSLLKPQGRILMFAYVYNQSERNGPPFSISTDLLKSTNGERYNIDCLESVDAVEKKKIFQLSSMEYAIHFLTSKM